jgi:hypothetical protein
MRFTSGFLQGGRFSALRKVPHAEKLFGAGFSAGKAFRGFSMCCSGNLTTLEQHHTHPLRKWRSGEQLLRTAFRTMQAKITKKFNMKTQLRLKITVIQKYFTLQF